MWSVAQQLQQHVRSARNRTQLLRPHQVLIQTLGGGGGHQALCALISPQAISTFTRSGERAPGQRAPSERSSGLIACLLTPSRNRAECVRVARVGNGEWSQIQAGQYFIPKSFSSFKIEW